MLDKRILLAFFLSFAVLIVFQVLNPPVPPAPATPPPVEQETASGPVPAASEPLAAPAPIAADDIREETSRDVGLETSLYSVSVSNTGGVLKSFVLQQYPNAEGRPLELINGSVATRVGWPLAFATGDPALDKTLAEANFKLTQDGPATVLLEYASQGVQATKRLEFDPEKYVVRINAAVMRNGAPVPSQLLLQGGFGDQSIQPPDPAQQQAVYGSTGSFSRVALPGIEEPQEVTASLAGIEDRYFLAMFIAPQEKAVRISKADFNLPDGTSAKAPVIAVAADQPLELYVGPKQDNALAAADPRLAGVPNYGWFGFITKPLLIALRGIHQYVGNYGWAIVILTVVINIVMFPLRVKQQVSMQKLQKSAPQMRSLQEKYKKLKPGDPKRAEVEAELMKMNKEQLSGCLPSLLQMPLLLAFWSMLSVSIELRHAPWILWITDLSLHDPYYVIPILMGLSMFISQKMMPTSMDPAQAKMMMIMPLIFLGFFLWAQSGVALYWLTSNVAGIAQTWFIREYWSEDAGKAASLQRKPQGG